MDIVFKRNALYDEVWSAPLTALAKKYGLSDNGLRKICKAMNIPLPTVGHWAKISAGKRVVCDPLPKTFHRDTFTSRPPVLRLVAVEDESDAIWLAEREQFERDPKNLVQVEANISRWHPLVRESRAELTRQASKAQQWARAQEKTNALSRGKSFRESDEGDYERRAYEHGGRLLGLNAHNLPFRVTLGTWERALRITHTLLAAAEQRGFLTKLVGGRYLLEYQLDGSVVELRLSERLDIGAKEVPKRGTLEELLPGWRNKIPTGVLRAIVGANCAETALEDRDGQPLENQLNEVLIRAYRRVNVVRRATRDQLAWNRRWEEEKRLREMRDAERQEQLRRAEEEEKRRRQLLQEVKDWQNAKQLREYLHHLRNLALRECPSSSGSSLKSWLEWASQVAEEIDPTVRRLCEGTEPAQY